MTRLLPLPPSKKRPDLVGRGDPRLARQRKITPAPARHHVTRGGRLPAAVLAADADHEILPTTTPARIDHPAPATRRHARAEPVLIHPLTITRLVCRLHRNPFRISRSLGHSGAEQTDEYRGAGTGRQSDGRTGLCAPCTGPPPPMTSACSATGRALVPEIPGYRSDRPAASPSEGTCLTRCRRAARLPDIRSEMRAARADAPLLALVETNAWSARFHRSPCLTFPHSTA